MIPRPFFVYPYFEVPRDATRRIPPHRLVIEPLVRIADEICVFQSKLKLDIPVPPYVEEGRGQLRLDLTQELVRGWESFWNAPRFERGAVTIKFSKNSIDLKSIFEWTQYGGVWSSQREISKGSPKSAVKYCNLNAVGSSIVACLSASNGIQLMDIWCDLAVCDAIDDLAQTACRHFVRDCEVGKFPREIVYDVSEYRDLV